MCIFVAENYKIPSHDFRSIYRQYQQTLQTG
jgi:hypothetical protein